MTWQARNLAYLAIVLALLLHGALLPFTYSQTYDAYIHMFFADHYHRQWFDPWETRWYTGFTVTAYPPGSHQSVAILMNFMDMRAAFVTVMTGAIVLLTIGIYRFSQIWVSQQAAAIAAFLTVFSTSIAETVHLFGQLPTIFSIALFLNAMPHMARWVEKGGWQQLCFALCFTAGATSAHHVTPLFGTIFFVAPIGLAAWIAHLKTSAPNEKITFSKSELARWLTAPTRGIVLGVCMLMLIVGIVFPYWYWSITDPITQVSIPHGSRENFIEKPNLGLMFFAIPWGLLIFVLPYVVLKLRTAPWPLGATILFALVLGTGGTTPIPKIILGGAFDILTLDRFTFWATLLILPFAGLLALSLLQGRARSVLNNAFGELGARLLLVFVFAIYAIGPVAVAMLPKVRPTQPDFVDPAPIVKFMDEDGHNQWRYLTLGLGDQFAYHSALINAESVDGNYNSARRLPSLTNYAVERLENSKYAGVPGLASLNQFLTNADKFHLKYVFSNDEYYDPLLHYTGWNPVVRLSNGLMVWEKANIPPLPDIRPKRELPAYQVYWWGIVPITGLSLAFLSLLLLAAKGKLISQSHQGFLRPYTPENSLVSKGMIWAVRTLPFLLIAVFVTLYVQIFNSKSRPLSDQDLIVKYYGHLDFREYDQAFGLLDTDITYADYLRDQRLRGGLLPSYGKLIGAEVYSQNNTLITTKLKYLTAIGYKDILKTHLVVDNKIVYESPAPQFSQNIVIQDSQNDFLDQTSRNIVRPGQEKVAKLQRPRISATKAYLYKDGERFFVTGQLTNTSPFPACVQLRANAMAADGEVMVSQNMGRLGAHRLLPGETSPYIVEFEGYLKISEASFNTAYDPKQFSVPEFSENPKDLSINIQSTVCAPDMYKSLAIQNPNFDNGDLVFTIVNYGTKIINTLQLKIAVSKDEKFATIPFYIQESLRPGETRIVRIPRPEFPTIIGSTDLAKVNGIEQKAGHIIPGAFKIEDLSVQITFDAMTYEILR